MNHIEIPLRGIYKEYAGAWDEISAKDAPYIGKCLYWLEMREIDVDMFRKLIVDRLINRINSKTPPMRGDRAWDFWANEGMLADTVNFFFKIKKNVASCEVRVAREKPETRNTQPEAESYEVIPNFVKNLIPSVPSTSSGTGVLMKLFGLKYYGPEDFLGDMSFVEFKDLLYCSDKWMKTKEVYWLDRMMAISYRRKQWFLWLKRQMPGVKYQRRVKYNPTIVDFRIKLFEKLDIGAKYMFFQYVMGCLYMLKTDAEGAGIELDGHICNLSIVFDPKKSKEHGATSMENEDGSSDADDGIGLSGIIMALAESGVFGNVDRTSETNVWDVISRLYQLELQRREFDRKMRK